MADVLRFDLPGDELHLKLGGGLPRKSFILIEAENGIGKSILAQRFAYGALANSNSVTYVSSELSIMEFINQMNSVNYDIRTNLLNKDLKYITLFSGLKKIELKNDLFEKLLAKKDIFDSSLIIFDTISEFMIKDDMQLNECFALVSQLKTITHENKSILFCADPTMINEKFLKLLRSVSDVYLKLEEQELYGNKIRQLKVERFNGASGDVEQIIPFKVKSGVGIIPELTS